MQNKTWEWPLIAAILLLTWAINGFGQTLPQSFQPGARYQVCFTPGQDCQGLIVQQINQAKTSVLVQAYSFTAVPIARALKQASARGVDVRVILDKSQRTERYSGATFLKNAGIPVVIDGQPAIAHSKVMIVDQNVVITGSYNFTKSAQERNVENLLVIQGDPPLVRAYIDTFLSRWEQSDSL